MSEKRASALFFYVSMRSDALAAHTEAPPEKAKSRRRPLFAP